MYASVAALACGGGGVVSTSVSLFSLYFVLGFGGFLIAHITAGITAAVLEMVCGYLLLVECRRGCRAGAALQLVGELLRWPEDLAAEVFQDFCGAMPTIPVTNKYFSTNLGVVLSSDEDIFTIDPSEGDSHARGASATSNMLRQVPTAIGCVFLVDSSMHPEQVSLHNVPATCLFRAVVGFRTGILVQEREDLWYDACVVSGFEYVSHSDAYEVIPPGAETSGLLGGDYTGAARISQILHNTMWPNVTRLDKHVSNNGTHAVNFRAASENLVAVVSVNGVRFLNWFLSAAADRRFFTTFWPPFLGEWRNSGEIEPKSWNAELNKGHKLALVLANKCYTTMLDVQCVHPALFHPSMTDLFMAQYGDRRPYVGVLCWPPAASPETIGGIYRYPPVSVFIDHLRRWGVRECVVYVTPNTLESSRTILSPSDMLYCEEQHIHVLCGDEEVATGDAARKLGTTEADRLAEIFHTYEWPQRTPTIAASSSFPSFSLATRKEVNRVLLWACSSSALEEEALLCTSLNACTSTSSNQWEMLLPSMKSPGVYEPIMTSSVRNKYFKASIDLHCFGGARTAVMRETEPTVAQLLFFGVVVLVTTVKVCNTTSDRRVEEAVSKCRAAQQAIDEELQSSSSIILHDDKIGNGITSELCKAAESSVVHVLYVVDGHESCDLLVTRVEELLSKESVGEDRMQSSDHEDVCASESIDDTLSAAPIEVVYGADKDGRDGNDGAARLREILQQHVWPNRKMFPDTTADTPLVQDDDGGGEKKPIWENDAPVLFGCTPPPDYLVNPLTCRSERLEALSEAASGAPLNEHQQQELVHWMDAMKRHGHLLPHATRQRQAELLATRLGEHLAMLDEQ